tara:strand:- start:19 stop:159 length:141 start_codon:yes stop_codon:yes gene_type:complete
LGWQVVTAWQNEINKIKTANNRLISKKPSENWRIIFGNYEKQQKNT